MTSKESEDGNIGFQIAPMVDVVFVLMLFFMACAGWQVVERRLTVNLPSNRPALPGSTTPLPIVIEISAEGQIVANNQAFGTPADKLLNPFRDWLKTTQTFGGSDPVFIHPSPATRHERIMDVLNACRAAGIERVSFAP